ncbi:MAG: 23S rRNA (guanosine(2251)-2'-O)-methyltransferase RlmB [Clostridia bacterium]|nr:23S rRNA (guanosine(2251)-2'-O)-methyltransferase RlmB [Clostridia bacterium]
MTKGPRSNNKGKDFPKKHNNDTRRDRSAQPRERSLPPREVDENVISGRNAVKELLESGRDVEKIFISSGEREGSINLILGIASERGIPIFERDRARLDEMSGGAKHQGVIAIAAEANYSSVDEILEYANERGEAPFIVLCDGIEDPHNLGAIIRTAECSGVHGVIIPKRRAVGLTSTVAKSSAGALSHMRIAKVTNLAATLDELKERGLWAYAADMDGTDYRATDMRGGAVIVLGSEGFGISRLVKEKCDFVVSVKMYGQVNSMNVSCAAAVILTEAAHQRNN